ncbi:DUF664 domain-containing protein [Streptomyces chattanoogensis]|uniref:mycothiol transferase n=1 Tax=Streptomyces chattanoogensis TaxID=66876 RepID=UPI00316ACEFA
MKCAGLTAEHLRQRAVPPSGLSLLGLVRHLAEVERSWFQVVWNGEDTRAYWPWERVRHIRRIRCRLGRP